MHLFKISRSEQIIRKWRAAKSPSSSHQKCEVRIDIDDFVSHEDPRAAAPSCFELYLIRRPLADSDDSESVSCERMPLTSISKRKLDKEPQTLERDLFSSLVIRMAQFGVDSPSKKLLSRARSSSSVLGRSSSSAVWLEESVNSLACFGQNK